VTRFLVAVPLKERVVDEFFDPLKKLFNIL
jgi:hypothetical protein